MGSRAGAPLLAHYGVDGLKELVEVADLDERFALAGDDVDCRSLMDAEVNAQIAAGCDFSGQFALGIDHEGQVHFVISGKLVGESPEVGGKNFRLVLKNVVTEINAQLLVLRVEIMGHDGGLQRPIVHGQREVMADYGNLVVLGGLLNQRSSPPALGALEVLEDYQGDLRAFWRPEGRVNGLGGGQRSQRKHEDGEKESVLFHRLLDAQSREVLVPAQTLW